MACETVNSWTFSDIVGAFVELVIAFFLLCASSVVFFVSKFLGVFGLYLPCTCSGVLGNYCLHRLLLVHCLNDHVSSIQHSLKSNRDIEFESVLEKNKLDMPLVSDVKMKKKKKKEEEEVHEMEDVASCSSVSSARDFERKPFHVKKLEEGLESVYKEERVKDKRRGFRRRKKVGYGSNNSGFGDHGDGDGDGDRASKNDEHENKLFKRSASSSEEKVTMGISRKEEKRETIGILEQALEKERAAKAALYLDLEEERSAAASAADEAMAMILRLQEEKGSVEMESRQYHRMIEEKSAYDQEEMDILKEILARREHEKRFLENEIETYRERYYLKNKPFPDQNQEAGLHDDQAKKSGWSSATESSDMYNYFSSSRSARRVGRRNSYSSINGLPPLGNCKQSIASTLKRKSAPADGTERMKIENEVGLLRERLRKVQTGREKIKLPVNYQERDKNQLQLLEELAHQLQEIRVLAEPGKAVRRASLPPTPTKDQSKKRCVRSASMGILDDQ